MLEESVPSRSTAAEYSVNGAKVISSELSFTVRDAQSWLVSIISGLWLISIGLAIIIVTIWWSIDNSIDHTPRFEYYYAILIGFESTIFIICMLFVIQYLILPAGLPKIYSPHHKQKVPVSKHMLLAEPKMSISMENTDKAKQALLREKKLKRNKDPKYTYFICARFSLFFSMILTADWTLFNFSSICVMIFHLFYVIILGHSMYREYKTATLLQIFYHLIRSIADISPGICLILYWKAKETYKPYAKYINKFEKKLLSAQNNKENNDMVEKLLQQRKNSDSSTTARLANEFKYQANTKTLAATNSVLSNTFVRAWLFCSISFCLLYYLVGNAIQQNMLFHHMLQFYQNVDSINFVVNICILHPFVGVVLSRSIFLTLPVTETHKLQGIKSLLSITIIGIVVLFTLADLFYWNDTTVHFILDIVWSSIYILTFTFVVFKIISGLMSLSSQAAEEFERFYGFNAKVSWTQWFEGLFIVIIYAAYFTFSFTYGYMANESQTFKNHIRQISQMVFNLTQLAILYLLRGIERSPELRNYVAQKKSKYINTFKWFSVLNIIAFFYSFIYVSNTFYGLLNDKSMNETSAVYKLSFTFSFCMQYYPLWAIEQFDKWLTFSLNNQTGSLDSDSEKAKRLDDNNNLNDILEENDDVKVDHDRKTSESIGSRKYSNKKPKTIQRNKFRRMSEGNNVNVLSPSISSHAPRNYTDAMTRYKADGVKDNHEQDSV